jgi:hypothetical protein
MELVCIFSHTSGVCEVPLSSRVPEERHRAPARTLPPGKWRLSLRYVFVLEVLNLK